ncbi:class I SAM-dependent methyltransferase [Gordonia iterans]
MTFSRLLADGDDQQSAYIAGREQRFTAMLDLLELQLGDAAFTVVDLGCGPGSLANRILDRFAAASVIGVDFDPSLLELARRASPSSRHPTSRGRRRPPGVLVDARCPRLRQRSR